MGSFKRFGWIFSLGVLAGSALLPTPASAQRSLFFEGMSAPAIHYSYTEPASYAATENPPLGACMPSTMIRSPDNSGTVAVSKEQHGATFVMTCPPSPNVASGCPAAVSLATTHRGSPLTTTAPTAIVF